MKIALIGYGKMGKEVEQAALAQGHHIIARVSPGGGRLVSPVITENLLDEADVCIEFSKPPATPSNILRIAQLGKPVIVGTTGWYQHLSLVKKAIEKNGTACVYAPNFSLGLNLFLQLIEKAAQLFHPFEGYDVFAMETHHRHKLDSPSGTANKIGNIILNHFPRKRRVISECLNRPITSDELHLLSARAGYFPGTHSIIFDSVADSVELVHRARSRADFAQGALLAARWIQSRKGIYTFNQVLDDILHN